MILPRQILFFFSNYCPKKNFREKKNLLKSVTSTAHGGLGKAWNPGWSRSCPGQGVVVLLSVALHITSVWYPLQATAWGLPKCWRAPKSNWKAILNFPWNQADLKTHSLYPRNVTLCVHRGLSVKSDYYNSSPRFLRAPLLAYPSADTWVLVIDASVCVCSYTCAPQEIIWIT